MKPLACLLLVMLAEAGCQRRARPWEGEPDDVVVDASKPFLANEARTSPTSWLGAAPAPSARDAERVAVPAPPTRAGGLWRRCADGFAPSGDPRRDVERLGAICGPATGMRALGEPVVGTASTEIAKHPLQARAGTCYRVFAAAAPSVEGIEVALTSVRGTQLAHAERVGRMAILEGDRPFCALADDTLSLEVRAIGGSGRYALGIYQLPTPR